LPAVIRQCRVARVVDEHVVGIVRHVGPVPTNPVVAKAIISHMPSTQVRCAQRPERVLRRLTELPNDLRLLVPSNVPVARKRREHVLVAEVSGPRLVLFRRLHFCPPSNAKVFRKLCGLK
jgi:hypothetical protein